MYFIAQIKRNYTNLMILSIWPFNSNNEWESKLNENNKPEKNPKEELINLDTVIKLDKEKLLNLTNKELLSYSKEERLKYITEWNIDYSKVKSWEVKEITFLFWDWKDKKELFKKTTVWQVLWKEISEIKVWEIIYKRNWLDWEFFNWNRRLRIFTWTKVEIIKIREKNELNELKLNFDNEFNKKIEEFKINEKYKETIDKNSDIIEEAIKRWIKVEMIYDLFSEKLKDLDENERKINLEILFTKVDRIRSMYMYNENSEELEKYLKNYFDSWINYSFSKDKHYNYIEAINWFSEYYDVPESSIIQLIYKENENWNPSAKAPKSSAYWLWQMIDDTWAVYWKGLDRNNPIDQIEATVRYMREIKETKDCSWEEVLAYYNTWTWIKSISNEQVLNFYKKNPAIAKKIPEWIEITAEVYFRAAVAYYNDKDFYYNDKNFNDVLVW